MAKAKALRTPQLDQLAKELASACASSREPLLIPLSVVSLSFSLLGMPVSMHQMCWEYFANTAGSFESMRLMWKQTVASSPFMEPTIRPLLNWMDDPGERDEQAAQHCWQIIAGIDMLALAERGDGEILGPLYLELRSASWRKATGAFYTPQSVSRLLAAINDIQEGMSVCDPCCGTGGMLIAAAREMRSRGRDPRTVNWVMNDIDPIAVALAGVNAAAAGMGPNVHLSCSNMFDPATLDEIDVVLEERTA